MVSVETIIFDWSGTVSDDLDKVLATVNCVLQHYDKERISKEKFRKNATLDFRQFWNGQGVNDGLQEIERVYDSFYKSLALKPKPIKASVDAVKMLHYAGFKLAVCSSCPEEFLGSEIKEYGLEKCFFKVRGSSSNKEEKFRKILAELEIDPSNLICVGDMYDDIVAANKVKAVSVAIVTEYSHHPKERVMMANPGHIIRSMRELVGIIKKNYAPGPQV